MEFKVLGLFLFILASIPAQGKQEEEKQGRQNFPNLQFAIPAFGLLNTGGNFFAQSTVTKTVISTVATVTVPAFRTCTMAPPAMFMPCAGRKRRDVLGESEVAVEVQPTPSMKLIFDRTEITDPKQIAEILHLKDPSNLFAYDPIPEATEVEVTTQTPLERNLDITTVLYSSLEDETATPDQQDAQDSTNNARDLGITTETPYLDEAVTEATTPEPASLQDDEKARLGVGGGSGRKGSTITSTIPVTHVVSSFVTAAMQTLSVSYAGCSPAGPLPVVTSLCV